MTMRIPTLAAALFAGVTAFWAPLAAQEIKVGLSLPENLEGFDFVNGMYEVFKTEVEANSDMSVDLVYGGHWARPTTGWHRCGAA